MKCRWLHSPAPKEEVERLTREVSCSAPFAAVLWKRGFRDAASVTAFLSLKLANLSDPFLVPGVTEAVDLLKQAILKNKRITLYSDYDVDGLTSAALLSRCLKSAGAKISTFLPHRMEEGYGLSSKGVERCLKETKPELLVILDCGTNSRSEIEGLRCLGVETIVVDHHEPESPSNPNVLINPKWKKGTSDYTYLCTVGLVFKLCHGFLKDVPSKIDLAEKKGKFDLKDHLDLVALGTVADVVPLIGENRILVKHGLQKMHRTRHAGLGFLKEISGIKESPTVYDCAFRLGPRLNAAGRLESAANALELLMTADPLTASRIAVELDGMNRERRALQQKIYEEAYAIAKKQMAEGNKVLVVSQKGWHSGVVGIVAAKLAQKFHRPAFVISIDEKDGMGKGSGRSIVGFSLIDALNNARDFLVDGGGHTMAVGLTIAESQIQGFSRLINDIAEQRVDPSIWRRCLAVDLELSLDAIQMELMNELEQMGPFGEGNPPVLIALTQARVSQAQRVGDGKKHLSLILEDGGKRLRSIFFQFDDRKDPQIGIQVDVVLELQKNSYQGNVSLQARLVDLVQAIEK